MIAAVVIVTAVVVWAVGGVAAVRAAQTLAEPPTIHNHYHLSVASRPLARPVEQRAIGAAHEKSPV